MSGTKNELVDSVNAVAGKLDAAASELDALRQMLTELGTSYETAASQAGVWADAIRSYADTMRDGWTSEWDNDDERHQKPSRVGARTSTHQQVQTVASLLCRSRWTTALRAQYLQRENRCGKLARQRTSID